MKRNGWVALELLFLLWKDMASTEAGGIFGYK